MAAEKWRARIYALRYAVPAYAARGLRVLDRAAQNRIQPVVARRPGRAASAANRGVRRAPCVINLRDALLGGQHGVQSLDLGEAVSRGVQVRHAVVVPDRVVRIVRAQTRLGAEVPDLLRAIRRFVRDHHATAVNGDDPVSVEAENGKVAEPADPDALCNARADRPRRHLR